MNESGNIMKHNFASTIPPHENDSVAMMYIEFIASLQKRYDDLAERYSSCLKELEQLKGANNQLTKQVSLMTQEIKDLNTSLEFEKARKERLLPSPISADDSDIGVDSPTPRQTRKHKPTHINPDTVKRLKNDRRHYAVACDAALAYWQKLIDNGFVDENLRATPKCGVTVAARIACCFQNVVDPNIRWSFFERHWHMNHLQSNLHRSSYRDENKYATVNRIFGRPDDTPFVPKSQLEN